ncbi:MAG: 16S rRNA (uracil(1498)-N(3))-methyltransferase [Neomegalonema sp.]|nr:16S rRNA (uracil(1498)-N(3))-methyltransferase [Neomegalonema sp.]
MLERDAANYLFNVMRLGIGAQVALFNSTDGEWRAIVLKAGKRAGELRLLEPLRPASPPPDLWLLFAPLKKARMDFVIEKAVELGVRQIHPVLTRYTQSERLRLDRMQAQAVEAAEQCGMVYVPRIVEPVALAKLLADWEEARRLYFCDERGGAPLLSACAKPAPAAILIGPEGGFSTEEAQALYEHPACAPVSLGPRILRAETAVVAALTLWQASAGDWRGAS